MRGVLSVKAEDLRTLDGEELTTRLRGARRELYELRFRLAVGQLDDHRQIRRARKDIARILTVVHARRLGEEIVVPIEDELEVEAPRTEAAAPAESDDPEEPVAAAGAAAGGTDEETPENVETAEAAVPAPRRASRRRPAAQAEEAND